MNIGGPKGPGSRKPSGDLVNKANSTGPSPEKSTPSGISFRESLSRTPEATSASPPPSNASIKTILTDFHAGNLSRGEAITAVASAVAEQRGKTLGQAGQQKLVEALTRAMNEDPVLSSTFGGLSQLDAQTDTRDDLPQ